MSSIYQIRHIKALQVFVAVCETGGFTAAASALNVTQAAVSQQIRLLEDWLETPLFLRQHHHLEPTPAAEALLPLAREGFSLIARGMDQVKQREDPHRLTVTALPSFTSRWLVPRLGRFMAGKDIQVHLVPTDNLLDYDRNDIDVGIRLGSGNYPGLDTEFLCVDPLFPVYNPRQMPLNGKLSEPADLLRQPLLIDNSPAVMGWEGWFEAAGVQEVPLRPVVMITDASMLIDAAVRGQGVALARDLLVREELEAGRLVAPFDIRVTPDFAYYLVTPPHKSRSPKVKAFSAWLRAELAQD